MSDASGPPVLPVLDPAEQRVLGSLLEKQRTVPASYPLSLNALRTACNQSSSREPVVDYDDATVEQVARALKARGLVRIVWADTGRRTLKYHQLLDEVLDLPADERALITVLLLRGPQSPGELRVRTERLHDFTDRDEVETTLHRMAARESPFVVELERRPGQQDHRWVHLLGPMETGDAAPPAPVVDRESVLREGDEARTERVRRTFDTIAEPYAAALADELDGDLPFEVWLLDRIAQEVGTHPVVEVGCGPGHVTAHLASAGVAAQGVDLSPGMVAEARRRFPDVTFEVGDLRQLMRPATSDGWGGVLAWYSLIYFAESELPSAVGALARPIRPGGLLVLAMHAGAGVRHADSWFDREVDLDVVLHDPKTVVDAVRATGLEAVEWYLRGPITGRDETTERLYVLARRPSLPQMS
ncbi:DUF480 domain-containing protein [Lapillicoccus sp.]|uniref:DUF480 domain-containing protein n=1 Tax=Lapillicoccus sp. TaxID=1909287 RepID=UPI0025EE17F6|nr:DUF480 domain-containing protein [Lapillicoccus sp.]